MNYLRGAVNAISVPYQYYRDLNPSTLTGAIDVIVISRPKQSSDSDTRDDAKNTSLPAKDEESELLCSPFHVRFGKWQVLRPGDKKVRTVDLSRYRYLNSLDCMLQVDVFVNGNLIPFPMKIGEAGEAFFVFETDGNVPDELVTSPLLEATQPGQRNSDAQRVGRFGAQEGSKSSVNLNKTDEASAVSQEPDFLDLNASPQDDSSKQDLPPAPPVQSTVPESSLPNSDSSENAESFSLLKRTADLGKAVLSAAVETERSQKDKLKDLTFKTALHETEKDAQDFLQDKTSALQNSVGRTVEEPSVGESKGDEVLPEGELDKGRPPNVTYTDSK